MHLRVASAVSDRELVDRRRAQIVRAATELFGERGYHATTVRDIALRANVSTGLIYQYVEEKEDVLFLVLSDALDAYQREIPMALAHVAGPLPRLRAAMHAHCRVSDAYADATALAYREVQSLRPERRLAIRERELAANALLGSGVNDCVQAGLVDETYQESLVDLMVLVSHAWALKTWQFRGRISVDDYVDRGLDLLLNAVLTRTGRRAYRRASLRRI
jgi:AcrR family transcriptional regulator